MRFPNIQPPYSAGINQVTINTLSAECVGGDIQVMDTAFATTAWTANLLIFIPLLLAESLVVSQFFWRNGTTAQDNVDVGVYTEGGLTKLVSTGPTTATGTSQIQVVNVTDVVLPANRRLWLALGCDSATETLWCGNLIVSGLDCLGIKQQASGWSSGLPTTITPATPTVAKMPMFGFTGSSVI